MPVDVPSVCATPPRKRRNHGSSRSPLAQPNHTPQKCRNPPGNTSRKSTIPVPQIRLPAQAGQKSTAESHAGRTNAHNMHRAKHRAGFPRNRKTTATTPETSEPRNTTALTDRRTGRQYNTSTIRQNGQPENKRKEGKSYEMQKHDV